MPRALVAISRSQTTTTDFTTKRHRQYHMLRRIALRRTTSSLACAAAASCAAASIASSLPSRSSSDAAPPPNHPNPLHGGMPEAQLKRYVDRLLLENPQINVKSIPDVIERSVYMGVVRVVVNSLYFLVGKLHGLPLLGNVICLQLEAAPPPRASGGEVTPIDHERLEAVVTRLLSNDSLNQAWLPDAVERQLYYNVLCVSQSVYCVSASQPASQPVPTCCMTKYRNTTHHDTQPPGLYLVRHRNLSLNLNRTRTRTRSQTLTRTRARHPPVTWSLRYSTTSPPPSPSPY